MTHERVIEVFAELVGKRLASSCPGGTRPSISRADQPGLRPSTGRR